VLDKDASGGNKERDADLIKDSSLASFTNDVIGPSKDCPVIVDFWAPNCSPCAELTPTLERLVRGAKGAIKLVKINLQENQQLAAQLQIQSVPTVFIFKDGRPIDGFTGALPESELKKLFAGLIADNPDEALAEVLAHASDLLQNGEAQTAAEIFAQILTREPENPDAIGGIIKCYIAIGELGTAQETIEAMTESLLNEPAIQSANSALQLALKSTETGPVSDLLTELEANPDNHQARFDLAIALNASNDKAAATKELIEIMQRENAWNDGAAQTQLLEFFEIWGPTDPGTIEGRKKLSILLFS